MQCRDEDALDSEVYTVRHCDLEENPRGYTLNNYYAVNPRLEITRGESINSLLGIDVRTLLNVGQDHLQTRKNNHFCKTSVEKSRKKSKKKYLFLIPESVY